MTNVETTANLVVRCDCSCSYVGLDVWKKEDGSYDLYGDFYTAAFASDQRVRWRERLKIVWYALRGKEYLLNSIVLNREDASRVRDFLSETLDETA